MSKEDSDSDEENERERGGREGVYQKEVTIET